MTRISLKGLLTGGALAMLALPLMASTAFAQVADVPRNETLVLTPWGDQPAQFANVENWNPSARQCRAFRGGDPLCLLACAA